HEQHEFALRLLQSIYIVPIALVPLAVAKLANKLYAQTIAGVALCFFATASWYFSYPQFNAKFAYYSPSVSQYDVAAVRFMETHSDGSSYLVLSNQMTSAAALQEFGFARYAELSGEEILWYAIPTGGKLYEYYLATISTGDIGRIRELMTRANVDRIYLVMYAYWPWSPQLISQLEVQSDHIESINDRITIYQFSSYDEN
ncbi:MAG: hypothetical protein NUV56_02545, partial [Candidatus Uhrbacteria bacterium]|nr:hypothetical protein [Candidatus Uhrbacteria bacterium]